MIFKEIKNLFFNISFIFATFVAVLQISKLFKRVWDVCKDFAKCLRFNMILVEISLYNLIWFKAKPFYNFSDYVVKIH